jgi:predicted ribosome quality control (RQC) complex YloA/Tae2 family protein
MGKYANLIILDAENKILAALKIIDFAARPKTREGIFSFYISICKDLETRGV